MSDGNLRRSSRVAENRRSTRGLLGLEVNLMFKSTDKIHTSKADLDK